MWCVSRARAWLSGGWPQVDAARAGGGGEAEAQQVSKGMTPDRIKELARLAKVSVTARQKGKPVMVGVPLSTRDDRILGQRLAFALRHPHSEHAVLIDIAAAQVLLDRVSHDDTPEGRRG